MKYFQYLIITLMALTAPLYAKSNAGDAKTGPLPAPQKADGGRYKVFVQNVKVVGMEAAYAALYADKIANALSALNIYDVVTMKDIEDLFDYEKQKDLLACDQVSCTAEIGGAIGADYMLTSTVIKQEEEKVLSLSITFSDVQNISRINGLDDSIPVADNYLSEQLLKLSTGLLFKNYLSRKEQSRLEAQLAALKKEAGDYAKNIRSAPPEEKGNDKDNANDVLIDLRDGHTYKTVKINDQVWMAENLRYAGVKHYSANGNSANDKKYGYLYTWKNAKKACPQGWRLPESSELRYLVRGPINELYPPKVVQDTSWGGADSNETGFGALPAGRKYIIDKHGLFEDFGIAAYFWSGSAAGSSNRKNYVCSLKIKSDMTEINYNSIKFSKKAMSVRCLKDAN